MTKESIIPALLPKDAQDLVDRLGSLPKEIEIVHLDVLDREVWIPMDRDFEVHLMVDHPEELVDRWIDRGARRVIIHQSFDKLTEWRSRVEVGFAVEMHIPMDKVLEEVPKFDFVHMMSIDEIGAQGHPFDKKVFDRIREVRNAFPQMPISVDGGVSVENYQMLREAGVNRLVVGSHFEELWNFLTKK